MSDSGFTPLFHNPPGASGSDSLKVVSQGSAKGGFQPLAPSSSTPAAGSKQPCGPQPIITVKKDKDRVTRICVQCSCGQVVELECQY